jgi:heme A synthase
MSGSASRGAAELARFRRLVHATIAATFLLILVGGVVRVSDSGLGCGPAGSGTEGWPLCGGRVVPFLEDNAIVEFSHRILATVVVALIALMLWRAVRELRGHRFLVRGCVAALGVVLAQAALGGLTVEHNLEDELVAAHLGLAMVLLGTLLALSWAAAPEPRTPPRVDRGMRAAAITATALVLATIVAGGYVAGTEKEGVAGPERGGAHLACGSEFPGCQGEFLPFGRGRLVDIHLTHRALVYATVVAVLLLIGLSAARRVRSPLLWAAGGVLALQVLLGALNVWLGEHPTLIVAHLVTGTLLFGLVLFATMRLWPAPVAAGDRETEAAPERAPAPA